MDIIHAKQLQAELNSPTRLCGNISNAETLSQKDKKMCLRRHESLCNGIDIISPNCMILPNTPIKNIKAMIEARNKFCDM